MGVGMARGNGKGELRGGYGEQWKGKEEKGMEKGRRGKGVWGSTGSRGWFGRGRENGGKRRERERKREGWGKEEEKEKGSR